MKERTHKPPKVAAAKNLFSSVYVINTACFDACFYTVQGLDVNVFDESLF